MSSCSGGDAAERALAQIGTPFRLHGRTAGVALDCVGLAAHAVAIPNPPNRYRHIYLLQTHYRWKVTNDMRRVWTDEQLSLPFLGRSLAGGLRQ